MLATIAITKPTQHRIGKQIMKIKQIIFLLALLSGAHGTSVENKPGDASERKECVVQKSLELRIQDSAKVLTYMSPSSPLNLTLSFKDKHTVLFRDDITITNSEAEQYSERDGELTTSSTPTNLLIPEGWISLTLVTRGDTLEILYEGITVLNLVIGLPVDSTSLKGIVCDCSGHNPVWTLNAGETVNVPLQVDISSPVHLQLLEVTTDGSAVIIFWDQPPLILNTGNTTFRVNVSISGRNTTVRMEQEGDDQSVIVMTQPVRSPLMLTVGSEQGNVNIKLSQSVEIKMDYSHGQPRKSYMPKTWVIVLFVAQTCILTVVIVASCKRKKNDGHNPRRSPGPWYRGKP